VTKQIILAVTWLVAVSLAACTVAQAATTPTPTPTITSDVSEEAEMRDRDPGRWLIAEYTEEHERTKVG
jgi:ABC-type thiamine transport system substrate-binding protein